VLILKWPRSGLRGWGSTVHVPVAIIRAVKPPAEPSPLLGDELVVRSDGSGGAVDGHSWQPSATVHSSAETRDQREPGAGRSLEEIRRLRRLSGGHGVLGGEIYALRACRARDGSRWSERSWAGFCFAVRG